MFQIYICVVLKSICTAVVLSLTLICLLPACTRIARLDTYVVRVIYDRHESRITLNTRGLVMFFTIIVIIIIITRLFSTVMCCVCDTYYKL